MITSSAPISRIQLIRRPENRYPKTASTWWKDAARMTTNTTSPMPPSIAQRVDAGAPQVRRSVAAISVKPIVAIPAMNAIWSWRRSAYQPCLSARIRPISVSALCKSSCLLIPSRTTPVKRALQNQRSLGAVHVALQTISNRKVAHAAAA